MPEQWNVQQAVSELRAEMNSRFDHLDELHLAAVIDRAQIDGRVKNLEEKASWITAGIGASLLGLLGFFFVTIRSKLGL